MKVNQFKALLIVVCLLVTPVISFSQARTTSPAVPQFEIPFEKFVLPNGLTVIVHEDHKAPIVAVNVWYHVGSKNEKPGKTGFAHLFEHLMFNGSEHFNDDYFQALERIGATDLNGTTNQDRTNYFQNVPVSALDTVLWLESDRMGHLLGSINKEKLDEQRGVVQNEKRQGDNEPYSISEELITKAVFPASHPYSHTVIGSLEDLGAASLDDVKEWFKSSYGPGNAVVVIAGDIDVKTARAKVEKYFGEIPPGPPVAHFEKWVAQRTGEQRQIAQDRVPQARLYKVWNVPGYGVADNDYLTLLSDVLVSDKASRLYKRLVYDEQIATDVGAYLDQREIASLFMIQVNAKPGADMARIEKAVNEEVQKVLASPPAQDELERVRTRIFANFVRGAERIGGFGGKSDILARSQVFGGSPDSYRDSLKRMASATTGDLQSAGKRWLSDGVYTLQIVPYPNAEASKTAVDRSQMPKPGEGPEPKFPQFQRAKLSNGLEVIVAERHGVPVINLDLLVDAGFAADQFARPGTAALAMNMLDEGTKTKNSIEISKELASVGATLGAASNLDTSTIALSTLKSTLDKSLALFSDVILNPAFPQSDFERLQKLQIAGIQREKVQPIQMGLRVFPKLLYGADHAYGNPYSGSGTEESVAKLTRADLLKFHETWFKPNNATLVVVGDTTLQEIQPKLEALFAGWKSGQVPAKNISTIPAKPKPVVYLVDKPGAIQSVILAGVLAPPKSNPDELAIQSMNTVLGGAFISRLNMNLRENKHWSYGAGSFIPAARGQRIYLIYAPVQTDKTKESVSEIVSELRGILKDKLITADELTMAKSNLTQTLPGLWETNSSVADSIGEIVQFRLNPDYYSTYAGKVKALSVANLNSAAASVVKPDSLVWVVVGDREKIEKGIRELNLGDVQVIDADGNPVK
ncbi:MAG TPA: pitrilysin family protein [Pyrinomonadaceae bacterium]|nr:pitrilysin family protein [Pyrinomonadaceae bacterium]